jgi:competence protein ComEA
MIIARHFVAYAVLLMASVVASVVHAADPVNINTADAETLAAAINGVGVVRAQEIVSYREKNGPFQSVDELVQVSGIGMQTVDKSRANLTVKSTGD